MKGRYNGCHMTIYGTRLPGAASIARRAFLTDSLTEKAKQRIKVFDWYQSHDHNVSLSSRHFGICRVTLHRWLKRYKENGMLGFNECSRKPKNTRKPSVSWDVVAKTVRLRKEYPGWGKCKLKVLLEREGLQVSVSTVGRILKRKGLINAKISRKKRKSALRPKARFPKGMKISHEGDMVQIDVKHIMIVGGRKHYQFTAIDVLGKTRVLRAYASESSRNGALFLKECMSSFQFGINCIQTDNGSTFLKDFDMACKNFGIPHYFTYPRTPKQNAYVEISHQADEREFYSQGNACSSLKEMQARLLQREYVWNNIRPHQALGQLTPAEYSLKLKTQLLPTKDFIVLQT